MVACMYMGEHWLTAWQKKAEVLDLNSISVLLQVSSAALLLPAKLV